MLYTETLDTLPSNLYLAEQIKQGELSCAAKLGLDMYQLMEAAGHAVFDCVLAKYSEANHVFVLTGTGNNGGDAFVVARLIRLSNIPLTVLSPDPGRVLKGDAEIARQAFLSSGGVVSSIADIEFLYSTHQPRLVVDGLLGTGFSGLVRPEYQRGIEFVNACSAQVIAIDLPSGLDSDTGAVLSCAVKADYTVTFVALKMGLVTADGPDHCGTLFFAGIGIDEDFQHAMKPHAIWHKSADKLGFERRTLNSHKGTYGHVVCIGGAPGMPGAILMAAKSALRTGAGKVSVFTHADNVTLINSMCPELMVFSLVEGKTDSLNVKLQHADVIMIGPGLSTAKWGKFAFDQVVDSERLSDVPVVIDADALSLLAEAKLQEWFHDRVIKWVLTPHPLEAARLMGVTTSNINKKRVLSAQRIAKKYHSIVVLKGLGSIVTDGEDIGVNGSGNPGMATAGMGDVLTGVIAGFLSNSKAKNKNMQKVVEKAVFLHGFAGDLTAKSGEIGMIATDVMEQLPRAIDICTK